MARVLADENFPLPVVEVLRRLGHDVVTLADLGKAHQALSDHAVLEITVAQGRTIVTLDRWHFIKLHADTTLHAGLVVCTFDPAFEGQAHRIDEHLRGVASAGGRLFRITRSQKTG